MRLLAAAPLTLLPITAAVTAAEPPASAPAAWGPTAIDYSNVPYPYPVQYLPVRLFGQDLRMAYMDVAPKTAPTVTRWCCSMA